MGTVVRHARRHSVDGPPREVKHGLELLVVDYLGLVRPSQDDRRLPRYEQVQNISAGLKALAKELDLPIINLCQLNREADKDEPRLVHLRESGAIEQDSDMVLFIHHLPKPAHFTGGEVSAQTVNIIIAKHRHGQVGKVSVLWHPRELASPIPRTFEFPPLNRGPHPLAAHITKGQLQCPLPFWISNAPGQRTALASREHRRAMTTWAA